MAWFSRLANMIRSSSVSSEIEEELRYHIEARTAANVDAGMSLEEARRDARRRMGNTAAARQRSYEADVFL